MDKTLFQAYAIDTQGYNPLLNGYPVDHVFVVVKPNYNWPCYGRGSEVAPLAREVARGMGYAKWADLINGSDPRCPAGVIERVHGVCQNVANRLLVLVNADVNKANGDELVTLLYGKYGFEIDKYIALVKQTAEQLRTEDPSAPSEAEVDDVVMRITRNLSDEMDILAADFEERFQIHLSELDEARKSNIRQAYSQFQQQRNQVFLTEPQNQDKNTFQFRLAQRLKPLLQGCLTEFSGILGPEQYKKIFKLLPEQAATYLLGSQ